MMDVAERFECPTCPVCDGLGRVQYSGKDGRLGESTPFDVTCWGCGGKGKIVFRMGPSSVTVEEVENIKRGVFGPSLEN